MLDQFYTHEAIERHCTHEGCSPDAVLTKYCNLENVLPGELKCAPASGGSLRIRLEHLAFHALSRVSRSLDLILRRLVSDLERSGRAEGYLS